MKSGDRRIRDVIGEVDKGRWTGRRIRAGERGGG
jgi:hypothetical protein